MHRSRRLWIFSTIALLALSVIGLSIYRLSPVWERNSLTQSETIRLLPIGLFEAIEECDVCLPSRTIGTWTSTPNGILLHKFTSSTSRELVGVTRGQCRVLMESTFHSSHGYNPFAAYVQIGDLSCPEGAPLE
jgi:hypothetical protein